MANWVVVLDLGQFTSKIGFGGENEPRMTFYTITGTPKYKASMSIEQKKQIFVGNEIVDAMGLYKITHPIEKGEVVNWEMFEAIIDYIFYNLRIDPSLGNVLFTFNPFLSTDSKKKIFELFLEKYQCMGFAFIRDALLTMYSGGFDTGLVVDMGASNIRITPIYSGYILKHAIKFLELGGNTLDSFMEVQLKNVGFNAESSIQKELVRVLKESACFSSIDYKKDLENGKNFEKKYSLPDGSTIVLGPERFIVPELLFKPDLNGLDIPSLPQEIVNSINDCDMDIRKSLLNNIFLTGGSSMFPLFETRLKQEIENELIKQGKTNFEVRLIAPRERIFSNWVGGSVLSMIPEFQSNWITRKKYYDKGFTDELLNE
jgi:actin, other eukaryote